MALLRGILSVRHFCASRGQARITVETTEIQKLSKRQEGSAARLGHASERYLQAVRSLRDERPLSFVAFTCGAAFLVGLAAGIWRSGHS